MVENQVTVSLLRRYKDNLLMKYLLLKVYLKKWKKEIAYSYKKEGQSYKIKLKIIHITEMANYDHSICILFWLYILETLHLQLSKEKQMFLKFILSNNGTIIDIKSVLFTFNLKELVSQSYHKELRYRTTSILQHQNSIFWSTRKQQFTNWKMVRTPSYLHKNDLINASCVIAWRATTWM